MPVYRGLCDFHRTCAERAKKKPLPERRLEGAMQLELRLVAF
jgi:hypothetical protein